MQKYLDEHHIEEMVRRNSYDVNQNTLQESRCVCGIYENAANLPALTIPGGDQAFKTV